MLQHNCQSNLDIHTFEKFRNVSVSEVVGRFTRFLFYCRRSFVFLYNRPVAHLFIVFIYNFLGIRSVYFLFTYIDGYLGILIRIYGSLCCSPRSFRDLFVCLDFEIFPVTFSLNKYFLSRGNFVSTTRAGI